MKYFKKSVTLIDKEVINSYFFQMIRIFSHNKRVIIKKKIAFSFYLISKNE